MPLELQIIRASAFVRLGPKNVLDLDETKNALILLTQDCKKRGIGQALMDLRAVPIPDKPFFTATQLAILVDTFVGAGFSPDERLAILYKSDPHHGARIFAFISAMRGCQVRAFDDFEKALQWLSERENRQEGGVPVEIGPAKHRTKVRVTRAERRMH
jgi:hypothetical protein